jgi:hypothetical protein
MSKLSELELQFNIRDWSERDFVGFKQATQSLDKLSKNVGISEDRFKALCHQFKELARTGNRNKLISSIKRSTDVRVISTLWLEDETFRENFPIYRALLDSFLLGRRRLPLLALMSLLELYFKEFDNLTSSKADLENFLKEELSKITSQDSELSRLAKYRYKILSSNGPRWLVHEARRTDIDLANLYEKLGLNAFGQGRYMQIARTHYYLETLKTIEPSDADNTVLAELKRQDVFNAPYSDKRRIGHEVLSILIDRVSGNNVPEHWRSLVLTIAGDPRVASSHNNYQVWWSLLEDTQVRKVRGWLSKFDLKLFLEALKESAKDANALDIERMFTDRKNFMEGLDNQDLILESRLFLSRTAEMYILRNYKKSELPTYVSSGSTKTSVIYLNVNGVHMVEGSHSFTLKLMDRLPIKSNILNYSKSRFSDSDFRTSISSDYYREYNSNGVEEIRHDQLIWQNKAINFLAEHGVNVNVEDVLSGSLYKQYKRRFGV